MSKQTALIGKYEPPFLPFENERRPDTLYVLSFGGGVNSAALTIELIERKAPLDYIIFADTGAEMPETIAYLQYYQKMYLNKHSHVIHVVKSRRGSLIEIAESQHIIPRPASTRRRWCTTESKIVPVRQASRKFMKEKKYKKVIVYVGFASDEGFRIAEKSKYEPKYIDKCYPLVDFRITRQGCKDLIKKHNLFEPIKSGCFFCEYQKIPDWERLYRKHPDYYARAVKFEKQAYVQKTGEKEYFNHIKGKPISLEQLAEKFKNQQKIFVDEKEYDSCPDGCRDI